MAPFSTSSRRPASRAKSTTMPVLASLPEDAEYDSTALQPERKGFIDSIRPSRTLRIWSRKPSATPPLPKDVARVTISHPIALRSASPPPRPISSLIDGLDSLVGSGLLEEPEAFPDWLQAPALASCRVVRSCDSPEGLSFRGLPFFELFPGDSLGVLMEAGHPSLHDGIPISVEDDDDCLLLARDDEGNVGWVLASCVVPADEDLRRFKAPQINVPGTEELTAENTRRNSLHVDTFSNKPSTKSTMTMFSSDDDDHRSSMKTVKSISSYKSRMNKYNVQFAANTTTVEFDDHRTSVKSIKSISSYKSRMNQYILASGTTSS